MLGSSERPPTYINCNCRTGLTGRQPADWPGNRLGAVSTGYRWRENKQIISGLAWPAPGENNHTTFPSFYSFSWAQAVREISSRARVSVTSRTRNLTGHWRPGSVVCCYCDVHSCLSVQGIGFLCRMQSSCCISVSFYFQRN